MTQPWPLGAGAAYFDYEAQPKEHAKSCDLCGAFGGDGKAIRDRYGFPVQQIRCVRCGLIYQPRPLAPAGLRALYSGPYRALVSAWHGREINAQTLEPEQREYGRRLDLMLHSEGVRFRQLLDLGGSTGIVAEEVSFDSVWAPEAVTVVEPNPAEAAAAARRVGRVVVQSAEDFDPGDERWDLVLLCQTVDHLRSISAVLCKVRGLLAPGGRFFVDAVDSSLIPEPVRYKVDHIYSLTPATMRAYLERAGFVAREVPAPSENHVAFLCEVAE